jgi:SLT domain-containing protein
MGEFGFGAGQWSCLDKLVTGESTWNYKAKNPSSGAYGLFQSLPASKMSSVADDWATNPVTQIRWGLQYIKDSYGTPCGAWSAWNSRYPHWY